MLLIMKCNVFNLSFDGVLKTPSFDGGGLNRPPPPFLFVKTIEKAERTYITERGNKIVFS